MLTEIKCWDYHNYNAKWNGKPIRIWHCKEDNRITVFRRGKQRIELKYSDFCVGNFNLFVKKMTEVLKKHWEQA